MQEKEMISDYLAGLNSSLASYGNIISQCENEELRSTIQLMRDQKDTIYLHNKQLQVKLLQLSNNFHKDNSLVCR